MTMAVTVIAMLAGTGLIAFWAWGLLAGGISEGNEPWPGFREHELAFAAPDTLFGACLLAAAWTGFVGFDSWTLLLLSAGGLLFLGVLDLSYWLLTWRLRTGAMRWRTPVLATAALTLGAFFAMSAP